MCVVYSCCYCLHLFRLHREKKKEQQSCRQKKVLQFFVAATNEIHFHIICIDCCVKQRCEFVGKNEGTKNAETQFHCRNSKLRIYVFFLIKLCIQTNTKITKCWQFFDIYIVQFHWYPSSLILGIWFWIVSLILINWTEQNHSLLQLACFSFRLANQFPRRRE